MLQGQIVEYVDSFCYLGSTMTINRDAETDVDNRHKARAASGWLHSVWKSSYISRRTQLRIFNACVESTLLYSRFISNTITQKLHVFLNKCLRIICRISWPNTITKAVFWIFTEEEPIQKQIKQKNGYGSVIYWERSLTVLQEWCTVLQELRLNDLTYEDIKTTAKNLVRWMCFV